MFVSRKILALAAQSKRIVVKTATGFKSFPDWKLALNPILNTALSTNPNGRPVEFEVFTQVMRNLGKDFALGIEHYASLGRLSRLHFDSASEQTTYLVTEFKTSKHFDFHTGVGHGWTSASDKLVFKMLLGVPF